MTGLSRIAHIICNTTTVIILFLEAYARKLATSVQQVNKISPVSGNNLLQKNHYEIERTKENKLMLILLSIS